MQSNANIPEILDMYKKFNIQEIVTRNNFYKEGRVAEKSSMDEVVITNF